jgi:hypothetical protein
MSAGSGIEVSLPELDGHVSEVGLIAADVRSCAQRVEGLGALGSHAFGLVGQVVAAAVEHWMSSATGLLNTCADAADDLGAQLGAAHHGYLGNEQAAAEEFDGIRPAGGAA